jgi:hypothetical protein
MGDAMKRILYFIALPLYFVAMAPYMVTKGLWTWAGELLETGWPPNLD